MRSLTSLIGSALRPNGQKGSAMTKPSTNIIFHRISRVEVGLIHQHSRGEGVVKSWQAVTLYLYDDKGYLYDTIGVHSSDGHKLTVTCGSFVHTHSEGN